MRSAIVVAMIIATAAVLGACRREVAAPLKLGADLTVEHVAN
jgi:hypothetical protein